MKRLVSFTLVLCILFCLIPAANANQTAENTPSICINGQILDCSGALPVIQNDRILVPMRAELKALDATVDWDEYSKTATASKNDEYCAVQIGSDTMKTGIIQSAKPGRRVGANGCAHAGRNHSNH